MLSLQSLPSAVRASAPELHVNGFSLHAAVRWRADQRKELEQLCRYITRPAIANERLKRNRAGQVVLQLKSPYKDGTTHIVMEPLEFMERLAALVPAPASPSDPLPRRAGAQRQVAQSNRSRSARACERAPNRSRPSSARTAAHELGQADETE